jgi:hypothetical protein
MHGGDKNVYKILVEKPEGKITRDTKAQMGGLH